MPRGYIYKYTFPDGKVYIGQTRRPPEERHREHFDNTIGKANPEFWEAYQKVGTPEFEVVETFECDRVQDLVQQLNESETQYIQQFKAANPKYGYNVRESAYVAIPRDAVLDAEFERIWIERAEKWYPTFVSVQNKCFHTFEPLDEDELKFCKKILRENIFQGAVTELGFDFQNLKVNSEDARCVVVIIKCVKKKEFPSEGITALLRAEAMPTVGHEVPLHSRCELEEWGWCGGERGRWDFG